MIRDIFYYYCFDKNEDMCNECGGWAFGDRFKEMFIPEMKDKWNELHGDLFKIEKNENIRDSLIKIAAAYKKEFGK